MIPNDPDSNQSRSRLGVRSLLSSIGNSKSASKGRLPMSSTWYVLRFLIKIIICLNYNSS